VEERTRRGTLVTKKRIVAARGVVPGCWVQVARRGRGNFEPRCVLIDDAAKPADHGWYKRGHDPSAGHQDRVPDVHHLYGDIREGSGERAGRRISCARRHRGHAKSQMADEEKREVKNGAHGEPDDNRVRRFGEAERRLRRNGIQQNNSGVQREKRRKRRRHSREPGFNNWHWRAPAMNQGFHKRVKPAFSSAAFAAKALARVLARLRKRIEFY